MKNLLVAGLVILGSFATISCTKTDEGLQSNNQADIQARRAKGGGSIIISSIPQVTGLSATAVSSTAISLTWNSVPNATTYWIYRDTYVPAIITSTSYIDKSLSPGTTYTYAIAAVVNSTLGPKSASVTVTTPQ